MLVKATRRVQCDCSVSVVLLRAYTALLSTDKLMDDIFPMSMQTTIDTQIDKLLSFHGAAERRLYQPYCVTEASSRCQSPDATYRGPLRTNHLAGTDFAYEAQNKNSREIELEGGSFQCVASSRGKYQGLAFAPQTGSKSQGRHVSPNSFSKSGDTLLTDTNHTRQAVTPRGSHSLASSGGAVYNGTLSHLRMQQSLSLRKATSRQNIRKTLPWHDKHARANQHPLPSVPEEAGDKGHKEEYYRDNPAQSIIQTNSWLETGDISRQKIQLHHLNKFDAQRSPVSTLHHQDHHQISRHDVLVEGESKYPDLTTPLRNASTREPSRSPESGDIVTKNAQLPSLVELYPSREQLPDTAEDQKAPRRTRTRDANLKYQFGQLPSLPIELPQKTSPNHENPSSLEWGALPRSWPRKSRSFSTDTQSGPRPPPWGSYDSLAMQRQQRTEARERIQLCTHRKHKDHAVISHSGISHSSDSIEKDVVRKEVDEYRRQVLSVYPELELDGGVRFQGGWCCCIVM